MLRPIRLLFLLALAFVSGILWERFSEGERGANRGGVMQSGICVEPK